MAATLYLDASAILNRSYKKCHINLVYTRILAWTCLMLKGLHNHIVSSGHAHLLVSHYANQYLLYLEIIYNWMTTPFCSYQYLGRDHLKSYESAMTSIGSRFASQTTVRTSSITFSNKMSNKMSTSRQSNDISRLANTVCTWWKRRLCCHFTCTNILRLRDNI